ncbi:hypothetical protein BH24ACT14_BH24ACT14_15110 [soil metagenome]
MADSAAFYDIVLAPPGGERLLDFGEVIGFGVTPNPDFWLGPRSAGEGFREAHIAFGATPRPSATLQTRAGSGRLLPDGPQSAGEPRQ